MKRIFIAVIFILFAGIVQAQNVGIGTTTPVAKLNIDGVGSSPTIPSVTSTAIFRIGVSAIEGIDFGKDIVLPFSAWMQAGYNGQPEPISLQPLGGNVGIGILSPTAKLDVNGTMKIQGINTLEFGAGVTKELNAGKIGYQTFTPGALDIVGAGTLVSNRKVNIFAEGGTTFNGPINVGGSTGTVGQVLTSNGTAPPTWTNTALSNDVRFEVSLFGSINTLFFDPPLTYSTVYNLNSTAVTISASGITVNRSGLYHIEGYFTTQYDFTTTAPTYLVNSLYLNIDGRAYTQASFEGTNRDIYANPIIRYRKLIRFVQEVYIGAPGNINLSIESIILGAGSAGWSLSVNSGIISGYLISD